MRNLQESLLDVEKTLSSTIKYGDDKVLINKLIALINDIKLCCGYSKLRRADKEYQDMIALWSQFPVGTKLKYKHHGGTDHFERIDDKGGYGDWIHIRAPWNKKEKTNSEGVAQDYYVSGVVLMEPLAVDE